MGCSPRDHNQPTRPPLVSPVEQAPPLSLVPLPLRKLHLFFQVLRLLSTLLYLWVARLLMYLLSLQLLCTLIT